MAMLRQPLLVSLLLLVSTDGFTPDISQAAACRRAAAAAVSCSRSSVPAPHSRSSCRRCHLRAVAPLAATSASQQLQHPQQQEESELMSCLREGIKAVAVGVKGSKPIPDELVAPMLAAIEQLDVPAEASPERENARQRLASFLGTLFVKHEINAADTRVLAAVAARRPQLAGQGLVRGGCSSAQLVAAACGGDGGGGGASTELLTLCTALLDGERLTEQQATALGRRLFDGAECAAARTLAAHVLRVRYETRAEFAGLLRAQGETVDRAAFGLEGAADLAGGRHIAQLAEPFDGIDRSPLLTPLIARHLQRRWGMLAVTQVGPTSGPKYGPNARDLALALGVEAPFAKSNADVAAHARAGLPEYGIYIDQEAVSPALADWVPLRRNIIKRPFLATSEKLVDSCGASVLIASAFHPSFTDKMFDMAEDATHFPACIIVRRGLEGTLGFGLGKPAQVTCGVRGPDGRFVRHDFSFGPADAGVAGQMDKPLPDIDAGDNAAMCTRWAETGSSGDARFDAHAAVSLAGLDVALNWVMSRLPATPHQLPAQR